MERKKIIESERLEGRGKRGRVRYRCKLECGHVCKCGTADVKKGSTYCMDCYFIEAKKEEARA